KLPSERELAESFGVSRNVVREAIRILQTRGLLEVKQGIGSIVRFPGANHVIKGLSLLIRSKANGLEISLTALLEVRMFLETDITMLAARRATAEDIEALQRVVTDLETLVNLPTQFLERAVDFHRTLAVATHNPLLLVLFDSIQEMVYGMRQTLVPEPIAPGEALKTFEQVLKHVQARNPEAAIAAMQQHLIEIQHKFEHVLAEFRLENDRLVIGNSEL
ncbi:MAG: FadR/GntR family transcriptional regulator, partial [Chloroflexota bacterium]